MKKKIYISGPISGIELLTAKEIFKKTQDAFEENGFDVLNPFNNGIEGPFKNKWDEWSTHMRADIKMLMDADAVFVLPEYNKSKGVELEIEIATKLCMPIYYASENYLNLAVNGQISMIASILLC